MPRVTLRLLGFGVPRYKWEELGVNASGETVRALWEELGSLAGKQEPFLALGSENLLVLVNGRPISQLGGWDTPLADGDEVAILPLVVGGSRSRMSGEGGSKEPV